MAPVFRVRDIPSFKVGDDGQPEVTGSTRYLIQPKERQTIKADPTDDAHETTHRGPASNDSIYSTVPSDDK